MWLGYIWQEPPFMKHISILLKAKRPQWVESCSPACRDGAHDAGRYGSSLRPPHICRLSFPAKTNIFASGKAAEYVYKITAGTVGLSRLYSDGRRQLLGFAFPGQLIGVESAGRFLHDAEALTKVDLQGMRRAEVMHFTRDNAGLKARVANMTTDLTASLLALVTLLAQRNANARVASFLAVLAVHAPRHSSPEGEFIELQMRREDIADYVSLAPESVCRALSSLESAHLITFANPRLFAILDLPELTRVANDS
jgi:CRP/FNR family transcriptional regulator